MRQTNTAADFEVQVLELLPDLKRYAFGLTHSPVEAEDLVQDCLERALRKTDLFQPGSDLRSWMAAVMHNLFVNGKRREKVASRYADAIRGDASSSPPPPQVTRVFLGQAMSALDGLGMEDREIIRLLGLEERSHAEASATLDIPVGTTKSRLLRARSKLYARLQMEKKGVFASGAGSGV